MINHDILKIANQACLKILAGDKTLEIKHLFLVKNKSILGIMFFLCGGIFLIIIPFIKNSDMSSKILGPIIGGFLLVFSVLTLLKQVTDRIKISNGEISVRYKLKTTSLPLNKDMTVKMKTELVKIRRVGTLGSDFILVTHYLQHTNGEIPILTYQMDNKDSDKAIQLGKEITRTINNKFLYIN